LLTAKQKLSRQVREKDEEIEELRQKLESIGQEQRKLEKSRREVGLCYFFFPFYFGTILKRSNNFRKIDSYFMTGNYYFIHDPSDKTRRTLQN